MITHPLKPLYSADSKILILGSFPSVKSREANFYYGHPANRFWKVISSILKVELPTTIQEKSEMLMKYDIALWDVIESCDILGSSDNTIQNVKTNDLSIILEHSKIRRIFVNGNKAYELYMKYIYPNNHLQPVKLPSTSPANAGYSLERLIKEWEIIAEELNKENYL